jgi:hypothetical protein
MKMPLMNVIRTRMALAVLLVTCLPAVAMAEYRSIELAVRGMD